MLMAYVPRIVHSRPKLPTWVGQLMRIRRNEVEIILCSLKVLYVCESTRGTLASPSTYVRARPNVLIRHRVEDGTESAGDTAYVHSYGIILPFQVAVCCFVGVFSHDTQDTVRETSCPASGHHHS